MPELTKKLINTPDFPTALETVAVAAPGEHGYHLNSEELP